MGGFGSGRPSGSGRGTVEACRSIDVNRLHKTGCLRAGWAGGWQWTRDGEKVASINLRAETGPEARRERLVLLHLQADGERVAHGEPGALAGTRRPGLAVSIRFAKRSGAAG